MTFAVVSILILFSYTYAAPRIQIEDKPLDCHGKPADLYFLLDSSTSIWPIEFKKQLKFVNDIIDIFQISPTHTRVGVGSFSTRFRENFNVKRYDSKDKAKAAVTRIRQMYGDTYTYDALDGVRTRGLGSHKRPGVVRIAIVTTDGQSRDPKRTRVAARKLKEDGVTVFAVGIGKKTDEKELAAIASEPSDKFVYSVGNFDMLESIREELAMSACAVELQDAPIPGPACGAENAADIMFVADSKHTGPFNMNEILDFIANISQDLNTETGNVQVGIESRYCWSDNMKLGRFKEKEELINNVRNTKQLNLHHILKHLRKHSYKEENGGRPRARNIAVVFVDDQIDDIEQVIEQAELAKKDDIEIFVVAVGDKVNVEEIKKMCSTDERHFMQVDSYQNLRSIKAEFMGKFCHGL